MKNSFEKAVKALEKQGENYAEDNQILTEMGESPEEQSAIAQICDEIDETHAAFDEVVEAAKQGKAQEEWLSEELEKMK